ncbi:MFS transporter [Streptomyces griseorubiginosus]|uniref:MFS transporter n=1 Tax=Streptomyces griseorubiginosus TaxID=67304 RepID=UPI0033B7083E
MNGRPSSPDGVAVAGPDPARGFLRRWFGGPLGRLLVVALLTNTGRGVWVASYALFFTRSIGMSPAQVGVGSLVAGIVGIASAAPVGMIADRCGLRLTLMCLYLVNAVALLLYLPVRSFWPFVLVGCLTAATGESGVGVRTALITALTDEGERIAALARYRVISQIAMAAGAGLGALVIGAGSHLAYTNMLTGTAVAFFSAGLLVVRLPSVPRRSRRHKAGRVMRDGPYLALAALVGVLTFNWSMLSVGIPLWVAEETDAPRWTSGVVLVANTVAIALLQVRFSRSAETVPGAGRATLQSGLLLALSCAVFALTAVTAQALTIVVLFAGAAIHIAGELLYVSGSWGLSVGLMPDDAKGEYQGAMAAGTATAQALGPLLMTTLILGWPGPGWLALGALFVAAGWTAARIAEHTYRAREMGGGDGVRAPASGGEPA